MDFNRGLVSSIKFSKYSSCMTKLIVVKHFPWTYIVLLYLYYRCLYSSVLRPCTHKNV